jgi:HPt (histidine-containing phosphotransfer) domain-containing protein
MMDTVIRQWVRDKTQEGDHAMTEDNTGLQVESSDKKETPKKEIPGINIQLAMEQFGDDEEILELTLQSFVDNTPSVLEKLQKFDAEKIGDYVINVHGIKGICRNICAEEIAALAASLEQAGKSGDIAFIKENNNALIGIVEKLIADIKVWQGKP